MYIRTNTLIRRFSNCSLNVKTILFKSFCLGFYDISLWKYYNSGTFSKFRSCYNKCAKLFFGFKRRDSLTAMLITCSIPCFDTIIHNSKYTLDICVLKCANRLVQCISSSLFHI